MGDLDNRGGENDQDITEEMDSRYAADGSKRGSAILYGLFALVITLIVAAALFFGGRAVYRALTGSGGEDTTQEQSDEQQGDFNNGTQAPQSEDEQQGQTPGVDSDSNGVSDSQQNDNSENIPSTGDNLPATGSPTGM